MPTPISLKGEVTLSIAVKDRKASAQWYADHLGFTLLYDAEELGWCELATPLSGLTVGFAEPEVVQHGGPVPTFEVEDIVAARAQLEAKGVRFDGPTITHEALVKLATFYDPDDHALMLSQTLQG